MDRFIYGPADQARGAQQMQQTIERMPDELLLLMTQSNTLLYGKEMAAELLALRAENRALREALKERPAEQILEERFPYLKDSRP
jgi:hypothetical protein